MRKHSYLIAGIIFILFTSALILYIRINPPLLFGTQEITPVGKLEYGNLFKGFIFVQEIKLKKDYLNGIELVLASVKKGSRVRNTLVVLDSNFHLVFSKKFNNENLDYAAPVMFRSPRPVRLGAGSTCYICLNTYDGDRNDFLAMIWEPGEGKNVLFAKPLEQDDLIGTVSSTSPRYYAEGSLCYKTYESSANIITCFKGILILIMVLIGLLIIFCGKIAQYIKRLYLNPATIFLVLALLAGISLTVLTPPFQVPDENRHFYRAWQITEGNWSGKDRTVPASLQTMAERFNYLTFSPMDKTSFGKIKEIDTVKIIRTERVEVTAPTDIVPFLPQSLGIVLARVLNLSPLWYLYLGRFMNLFISVLLLYAAIRITPVGKWLFFLLGLMPMTIYLFASVSYDASLIAFSFCLIALVLRMTLNEECPIRNIHWILFYILVFLLSSSKPPYMILVFLFLMIPVKRVGTLRRYIALFAASLVLVVLISQSGFILELIGPHKAYGAVQDTVSIQRPVFDQTSALKETNPALQKQFVFDHPYTFIKILWYTNLVKMRDLYLETFIGRLGWLVVFLPVWLVVWYWLMLIIVSLSLSGKTSLPGWRGRLIMLGLWIIGVAGIDYYMYIHWTPLKQDFVEGIQGRYFIPLVPLVFLFFVNRRFGPFIDRFFHAFSGRTHAPAQTGKKKTGKIHSLSSGYPFTRLIPWFSILTAATGILVTIWVLLDRYYVILI
jgi:uncharacterized membrane protein